MADIDYTVRPDVQPMCPNAFLSAAMPTEVGPTTIGIFRMQHVGSVPGTSDLTVGMAVMIQDEIFRLDAFTDSSVTLSRGCADTIPQDHTNGAMLWFFGDWTGSDQVEYLSGEVIGIKPLPVTVGGNTVPLAGIPPQRLIFNSRQARPYAPGKLECDGTPWFDEHEISLATTPLDVTWTHRDRITQADVLVSHPEASVGPETDVSYTIKVYNASDTLLNTFDSLTGTTWSYSLVDAQADFGITAGLGPPFIEGYFTVAAVRDGLESWQVYKAPIRVSNEITP